MEGYSEWNSISTLRKMDFFARIAVQACATMSLRKDGSLALPAAGPPGAGVDKCQGNRLVAEITIDEFD